MADLVQHPDASPERVEPGLAPGGIVFRFYACPSRTLLHESLVEALRIGETEQKAVVARETVERALPEGEHVHIAVYDGDDGERLPPLPPPLLATWLQPGVWN